MLGWISEDQARHLISSRQASFGRRNGRVRVLILRDDPAIVGLVQMLPEIPGGRGTALGGQRYSHHRETRDNPANVWTLKKL
jgi:hypothetical protein